MPRRWLLPALYLPAVIAVTAVLGALASRSGGVSGARPDPVPTYPTTPAPPHASATASATPLALSPARRPPDHPGVPRTAAPAGLAFKQLPSAPGPVPPPPDIHGRPQPVAYDLAYASGCAGTTPSVTIDLGPNTWDFLTNSVTVTPAGGCSPIAYYYDVYWPGASGYIQFAPN